MNKYKFFQFILNGFPASRSAYDFFKKKRYQYLYKAIELHKCRRIMEIGLYDGKHALKMINTAKKHHGNEVEYYGFDLFEEMDNYTLESEVAKHPSKFEGIDETLSASGCAIKLFKGNTLNTLKENIEKLPKMDLIFIDGGHSLGTIRSDWKYSSRLMKKNTIVFFDDYWNREKEGCKKIIEEIDTKKYKYKVLPIQDTFKREGEVLEINFVLVRKI